MYCVLFQATIYKSDYTWIAVGFLTDLLYYLEIYIKFHTCYYDQNGAVIIRYDLLVRHYLHDAKGFAFDFAAIVPVELCASLFENDNVRTPMIFYFRLWHCLRIYRLWEYFQNWEKELNINMLFVRSFKFTWIFIMITHVLACSWDTISCPIVDCSYEGLCTLFSNTFNVPHCIR